MTPDPVHRKRPVEVAGAPLQGEPLTVADRLRLGVLPVAIFVGAFASGVDGTLEALIFAACLSAMLLLALIDPLPRRRLSQIRGLRGPALLFVCVLTAAGLSLTGWAPAPADMPWSRAADRGMGTTTVSGTIVEMIKLAALACAFVVGLIQAGQRRRFRASLEGLLGVGTVYAATALAMFLTASEATTGIRLTGGFLSANTAATLFGMLILIAMANWSKAVTRRDLGRTLLSSVQTLLFVVCLVLTASRSGIAATVVAGVVFVAWEAAVQSRTHRFIVLAAAGLSAMLAGLFLLSQDLAVSRWSGTSFDFAVRMQIFQTHWEAFQQSPVSGFGLGSFTDLNNALMTPENFVSLAPIRAAHNVYLQWLVEAGVLGCAPMFLLIGLLIVHGVRGVQGQAGADANLMRGLTCVSVVVLLHGLTDFSLQIMPISAVWAYILGLKFAMAQGPWRLSQ